MLDRIFRAIKLEPGLFREVANDPKYTNEAVILAVVVALVSASGAGVAALLTKGRPLLAFLGDFAGSLLLGWLLWAVLAYGVGTALGGTSGLPQMLRALAYAGAPRLVGLLGFIPCIGWVFSIAAGLLSLVAGVIAIREAMGFDTLKAVVTALLGYAGYIALAIALGVMTMLGSLSLPVR